MEQRQADRQNPRSKLFGRGRFLLNLVQESVPQSQKISEYKDIYSVNLIPHLPSSGYYFSLSPTAITSPVSSQSIFIVEEQTQVHILIPPPHLNTQRTLFTLSYTLGFPPLTNIFCRSFHASAQKASSFFFSQLIKPSSTTTLICPLLANL